MTTTKATHTPGPWRWFPYDYNVPECGERHGGFGSISGERWVVATIDNADEAEANAYLIAAAPLLLEAAEVALEDLELWHENQGSYQRRDGETVSSGCDGCFTCEESVPKLRAAIAAARGERG